MSLPRQSPIAGSLPINNDWLAWFDTLDRKAGSTNSVTVDELQDYLSSLDLIPRPPLKDQSDLDALSDYSSRVMHTPTQPIFHTDVVMSKVSGRGIKVDNAAPSFPWLDIHGEIRASGTGATDPTGATVIGNIKSCQFTVNDEVWVPFLIPHDYLPGSNLFIRAHWLHNATTVTGGNVVWGIDVTSAKGYNQQAFGITVNPTITQNASTTQCQHMTGEVQISSSSPSATQINNSTIEPDSLILTRFYLSANNMTVSGGGVPEPFLLYAGIHYQSTGIGTKQKSPNFYT